ncbi:MAG: bifunctional precorrin-2 dehydrogenase/sirohydrochlorin ferrochelatase [Bacteroidales bacterium]|nr:bifunctional precorrin-2 dehydrogenase/sirohydrochlorin ferrochelatase [Bacteroidales bacterium]HOK97860.1 bifunctional precorrin-2 dehydrogenase/sirohydrochlorin ferrochelatase [Bacteroidales bacterium]HPO64625.1 bifunctional precorrin-2 dehydrogenase/sirohydrochlorin ferrochelatase [Bacteroidales bacterium]
MKKSFMPISIDVNNKKILLIGGGRVAYHKILSLIPYANRIHIVAREIDPRIRQLKEVSWQEKEYEPSDLDDAFLIYACTNDHETNLRIKEDAHQKGILINVVDTPAECDFVSPAIYRKEYLSIAVSSNGNDVLRSISVRNLIRRFFEIPS